MQIAHFHITTELLSSDSNPFPGQPELPTEIISPSGSSQALDLAQLQPGSSSPIFGVSDVIALVGMAFGAIFLAAVVALVIAAFLPANRGRSLAQIGLDPKLNIIATAGAYVLLVPAMALMIRLRYRRPFFDALSWRWPRRAVLFVMIGVLTGFTIPLLSRLLPMPKTMPIDRMFNDSTSAWMMTVFGIFCAPLVEELFFRGFLYPVLTRWKALFVVAIAAVLFGIGALLFSLLRQNHTEFWIGLSAVVSAGCIASLWLFSAASRRVATAVSIVVTSLLFASIHSQQLAHAWAPVLVIFVVGLILTIIRARSGSLAASVLAHMGYNGTLFTILYFATDHFRHLEKMQ